MKQMENTVQCLQEHFDPSFQVPDRLDRHLKVKELSELLVFYLGRAYRYGLYDYDCYQNCARFVRQLADSYHLLLRR